MFLFKRLSLWNRLCVLPCLIASTVSLADTYELERDTCGEYSAKAVYQFHSQALANCGFSDARWNADGAGQHHWCRTVRPIEAERETAARAELLMKCLNPQGSINKNDLQVPISTLNSELVNAAGRGATERMQQVIAAGADLAKYQDSLMQSALSSQNTKTISFLMQIGLSLTKQNQSPLENFITYGKETKENLKTLKWLLSQGVNPNMIGQSSYTPLYHAITRENPEVVTLLLQSGANPNIDIRGKNCTTNMPMDSAVDTGKENIIALLRRAGAKPQAQCNRN
ncbi:ankyrin repeat domain-containing protein [Thiolinea disciformis]|uniref:ankyrin repeat domain-containing protein n=1 Tax=Thiolinea disciformis TaxID=125614 RepID=UPI0003747287|nr:ankyrin repeat domain-containing protein [Thiolinea disciformis]